MKVKVNVGRNKGQSGRVVRESGNNMYVSFGREILVNEGFGSMANYEDAYWVKREFVEKV